MNVRIRPHTTLSGFVEARVKYYHECNMTLAIYVFINNTIFIGKHYFSKDWGWNSFSMTLDLAKTNIKVPAEYKMGTLTMVVGLEYYHERLLTYWQGKSFSLCGWIFDSI